MIRLTALLLTVLTGFAGLVYEVAWQKYLATLLGSHGEATAAVLGIFLGGLAAGYALFGRVTRRLVERSRRTGSPARVLLVYGFVEIGIGAFALGFPHLFGLAQELSLLAPLGRAGAAFGFDVLLASLLIGPPTLLMGATIPMLTLALAGDVEHSTRVHAWVYGFNTLGAFAGALAGGFWLIPSLGLDGTVTAMAGLNLLAGVAFTQLDRGAARVAPDLAEPPIAAGPAPRVAGYAVVALAAGFAMMTLQTTLIRIGALSFGASQFTFAMVVAVFVLCIGLGSLAVSVLPSIPRGLVDGSLWATVVLLLLLYFRLPDATYGAYLIRTLFRQTDAAFYPYYYIALSAALAVLSLPIGLSGALLPLLFHHLRREVGDLGAVAGRLYAWNTVGSLLGALLGGYLLFFWLDLDQVYRVAIGFLAGGATLLTALLSRTTRSPLSALPAVAVVLALVVLPAWSPARLSAGLFREREPLPDAKSAEALFASREWGTPIFHEDDPTATVTVMQLPDEEGRLHLNLLVNGKSDGNLIGDYPTMALSGLVPALMAASHARCFVIGYGMGVTAGELASLEQTRLVDVAEISRGVIHAAPLFDAGNQGASTSPKVSLRRGDAFRSLLQSEGAYDVIVSEPSNPWVTGVEMLYSAEFLQAARRRLAPGGVYAQWFHSYESDLASVELVLRTYASVFPYVSVWFTMGPDLLLLGFDDAQRALDVGALHRRFQRPDFRAAFERLGIASFPALLAHELLPVGTLHAMELRGELHTLRHPRLSYLAARAFFRGGEAPLPRFVSPAHAPVGARNSLLRRFSGAGEGPLPEPVLEAAARESCRWYRVRECAALLASWRSDHPRSRRLAEVRAELESAADSGAGLLTPASIARLARFFEAPEPGDPPGPGGGIPLARAMKTSTRYLRHYHHAVPFDPDVLEWMWSHCVGGRCEDARRQLEDRFGELEELPEPSEGGVRGAGRSRAVPPAGTD